jgi:hypothetical protein
MSTDATANPTGTKRAREEEGDADLPVAKEPRVFDLSLDKKWRFITSGEDGACYSVHEWDPSTAKNPEAVARAFLKARETDFAKSKGKKYPSLYFNKVFDWVFATDEDGLFIPPMFQTLPRDELGVFNCIVAGGDIGDSEEHGLFNGVTLYYSSWC